MENFIRESGVKWLWERIKTLLSTKQDKLVSGTNIKTINGNSLLGSGDVSISGGSGGDFNSSGTYPNLTAGKATKLATARKIGLTGGAAATATNFDGSGNIKIPVTALYEDKLAWGTTNVNDGTIVDNIMRQARMNTLSFMPASAITAEYSNDGGATWIDYGMTDAEKVALVTPILPNYKDLFIGNTQTDFTIQNKTRVIIDLISGNVYGEMRKLYLDLALDNPYVFIDVYYEPYDNYNTDTWNVLASDIERKYGDKSIAIPSSLRYMGATLSGSNYSARLKIEIYRKDTGTGRVALNHIEMLASYVNKANAFVKNGSPMTVDWQQNATFPAAITATKHITQGGTANQVTLGNGSLKDISELSPITDADADILLDNHIHSINVNANGNNVNINVIESSKNGNTWETEGNDIPIPLATTKSAGVMSKEDKAKLDDLSVIEIKYTLTEHEYNNHEIVNLYNIVYAISNRLYNNGWLYNDDKSYDVVVKGWVDNRYNAITYANFNVRLLTTQDGHSLGINGYVDVAQITETNENADCPLWVGYICGKYHIEDDGMAFYAPENPNFIVEA